VTIVDGYHVDLSVDEARAVLATVPNRLIDSPHGKEVEIFYKDRWMILGRTDLKDNVCTTRPGRASLEYYTSLIGYGARVYDSGFFVIDIWSDG
jgi:hypothetical protein